MLNQDWNKLTKKKGSKNAKIFIEVLGRCKQFQQAYGTPIGQELLSDIILNMQRLMSLVLDEKDDDLTRADLRCYQRILTDWSTKINTADQKQKEFTQISGGN